MVPFAGYELPVQYPAGVLASHLHTRAAGEEGGTGVVRCRRSTTAVGLWPLLGGVGSRLATLGGVGSRCVSCGKIESGIS